ncbi:hypothetical protein P691DRAFT_765263 [Macrolepiota fuliginosa MF-IS2]|uniref:DUF4218 domain-containing protein n=1 Tax=Macrolepiota fuliginosa MF-IS2 TaxID=1400762 RepID=A0A9P5X3W8_9AGAR|nr:hypothetical protein P691DRAFT_765263 [Macrolepiota fuliginosa MF-IS2]
MENVFLVGVVPGPKEPSVTQISHLLAPLIDALLELWEPGIYLQQTPWYPSSRRIVSAVILLVCDLITSKKMAGFGSAQSRNFCSHCYLTLNNITNFNFWSWDCCTQDVHHVMASAWKAATSKEEQDKIFNQHGLQWSELLCLPYFNPTSSVVIDSMHCFYLGLFHRHAINIWGMDMTIEDGEGATYQKLSKAPTNLEYQKALAAFSSGNFNLFNHFRWHVVAHVCAFFNLHFGGTKSTLISNLQQYRASLPPEHPDLHHKNPDKNMPKTDHPNKQVNVTPADQIPASIAQAPAAMPPITPPETTNKRQHLSSKDDINFWWLCAPKSKWQTFSVKELRETLEFKSPHTDLGGMKKPALILQIQALRKEEGIIDEEGNVKDSEMRKESKTQSHKTALQAEGSLVWTTLTTNPSVFGSWETVWPAQAHLPEQCKDMVNLSLPSWVSKGPAYPGQEKGGKLHADQWWSFFTINLPITLTRLWGAEPQDSHKAKMLENFLYLVSVVKVVSKRTIVEEDILLYEDHMQKYLKTLWDLYPGIELTPYQHIALHFGDYLRRFSPTHGWRCFAFERYNYVLQQVSTNQLFGQMEKTMFGKFCMLQNLCILFNEHLLPWQLHPLIKAYTYSFNCDTRGMLMSEDLVAYDRGDDEDFLFRETVTL